MRARPAATRPRGGEGGAPRPAAQPPALLSLLLVAALALAGIALAVVTLTARAAIADGKAAAAAAEALASAAIADAKAAAAAAEALASAAIADGKAAAAAAEALASAAIADGKAAAAAAEAHAGSPDESRRAAHAAFLAAEAWRYGEAVALYANMTDAEWDSAARWKGYAQPDAPERTCAVPGAVAPQVLADIALLQRTLALLPAPLSNRSRSAYLALHAFHTTGLEGNTLTLPETLLTIAGQPLFGGFDARVMPSRAADLSATEAMNIAQLWDALGLSLLPGRGAPPPLDVSAVSVAALIDLNSAITRGSGTPAGLRTRPVAIGHQRVLLPMPDEVPVLVGEFLAWLSSSVSAAEGSAGGRAEGGTGASASSSSAAASLAAVAVVVAVEAHEVASEAPAPSFSTLERALALACDAHTRYVFVHPFADGNGRLARTLSALVLQRLGLPAAMVPRFLRAEYMAAVSAATVRRDYAPLAAMHGAAVRRSLGCLVQLAGADGARDDGALGAALGRSDCLLGAAAAAAAVAQ